MKMTPDRLLMVLAMTIEACCQDSIKRRTMNAPISLDEWHSLRREWDEICNEHMPKVEDINV